ncbi:MAG: SCO family protein [Burkholderiales bacterium]
MLGVFALGCRQGQPSFRSTDITGAEFGKEFALTDHNGKHRTLEDFRGQVVVLFFGFTHCPDVCPTTLGELASAFNKLGASADKVQVLMVSVDPERDTQEVLSKYVAAFHPRFLGLRGSAEETARVAKDFKVIYQKASGTTAVSYSMDHSAGTFIIDKQGRLRLYAGYGQGAEIFAHDIGILLKS